MTRPRHSADHAGQENIWFVRCLTATRATPASRESHSKTGVNGPNGLRELTMQTFHGVGHPAAKETARRISKFYYWPRLKQDVADYIASCHPCQATKPGNILNHIQINFLYQTEGSRIFILTWGCQRARAMVEATNEACCHTILHGWYPGMAS